MTKEEARAVLAEIVAADRWSAFADWMEELEESGGCSHDADTYGEWLASEGVANAFELGTRIYEAMAVYSSFGPCACAAGQDFLTSPHG